MSKNESRFIKRKAFWISQNALLQVMKELLDDDSLVLEEDYPALSYYSRDNDVCHEEDEILELVGKHIGEYIVAAKALYRDGVYFITANGGTMT